MTPGNFEMMPMDDDAWEKGVGLGSELSCAFIVLFLSNYKLERE